MNLFGIEIFDSGIFIGGGGGRGGIWQVFFGWLDLRRDFRGFSKK